MLVNIDHRRRRRHGGEVTLTMPFLEFREFVEWIESADPYDRATEDLRRELDRINPLAGEDDGPPQPQREGDYL